MSGSKRQFLIYGHRGLPMRFTENTMESFRASRNAGMDGIELDVQTTKDGQVIIYHDYEIEYNGKIVHPWDLTLEEARSIRLKNGEGIPTLKEVLVEFRDFNLIIELKTIDERMQRVNPGLEELVVKDLAGYDPSGFLFVSFDPRTMMELKNQNGKFVCGWNIARETIRALGEIKPADIKELGLDYIQPSSDAFTDDELLEFMRNGIPVIVWTVNTHDDAKHFMNLGINGIISDRGDSITQLFLE